MESFVTEYSYNANHSNSDRNTYEKDLNGKYTVRNALYSNNFDLNAYATLALLLCATR
jgi:hypothetical protein